MSTSLALLPSRSQSHRLRGILLGGVGAVAFSGKAIIVKLCYRYGVDAVTVITFRMLFALPLFLWLSWFSGRGKPPLTRTAWLQLFALGFSGYYLASFLDFAGLQYIGANLERLILYLNPTLVLIASRLVFKVPVTRRQWAALLLSYLGVALVFGHGLAANAPHVVLGTGLVLASAISYSLYLVYSGQVVKQLGAMRITGVATSIACTLCIAQFLLLRPVSSLAVPPEVIELSLLNATLCTFLPIVLIMLAIEQVGASLVAQAGTIGPVSTVLLSVTILGEPFTPWIAAGTALVVLGIWILTRARPGRLDARTAVATSHRAS
jgi:drug/metabolite transporter (DMT)-like permease